MSAGASTAEKTARGISPLLFVLVILCFFLAFAGVSCNTDKTRSAVAQFGGLGGNAAQLAQVNRCIDALNGVTIATYSGINLVAGGNPHIDSASEPRACNQGGVTSATTAAGQGNIGVQPLALLALLCIVAGALLGIAGWLGVVRGRARAVLALVPAGLAALLLLFDHLRVHDAIINRLENAAGSSSAAIPGFSLADYINISLGIGVIAALAGLVLVAALNIPALALPQPPPRNGIP